MNLFLILNTQIFLCRIPYYLLVFNMDGCCHQEINRKCFLGDRLRVFLIVQTRLIIQKYRLNMTVDSSMYNASDSISSTFVVSRLDTKRPKNVLGFFKIINWYNHQQEFSMQRVQTVKTQTIWYMQLFLLIYHNFF